MKRLTGLAVLGFILAGAGRVDAQVVTFDEAAPTAIPILGSVVCGTGSGFRFVSDHFHMIGGAFPDFSSNGTTTIGYESGRGFPITMERLDGSTFSLLSLDAAEFYSGPTDRPDAEMLVITGFQAGGGTVSYTVDLDGMRDGVGGVLDYQHVVLPSTFVNLTSVVFEGLRAGNLSGGVGIDNLEYLVASSPETLGPCVAIPLPPDAPTVAITSPSAGNIVGTVVVEAVATDNVAVASVQFKLDGVDLGPPDLVAPYTVVWDTTSVPDGPHTLTAEARDNNNNVASASVVVAVRNYTVVTTSPHSLEFDGVDDYLQVADAASLSFGNGGVDMPLTFELWLRPDAMVRHHLVSKWSDGANQEYKLHINGGLIRLDLRDSSAAAMASAFTAASQLGLIGGWHHLAVTYDGRGGATAANGIAMYIDGVAVALNRQNNAAYVAMENGNAPLQIGREGPASKHYDGGLDEVRFWNVARTLGEIQSAMTVEVAGAEPGLAAYWRFNEGTGTTAGDASPAGSAATLINGPAWVAGGPLVPPAPDVTAPEITNITITNVTASSATIAFGTNEVTTAGVSYTPGPGEVPSASAGTAHVVTLTGLLPDTLYQVTVHVIDRAGNPQTSSAFSLRTLVPAPDVTPPTVALVRPVGTVAGTVTVEASASDNVGVASVRFKLDGVDLGAPDSIAPYAVVWNTTGVADGPHTITVEAVDAANNLATASSVVTVANTVTLSPHSLEFDGVDDYLQVADAASLSFGSGSADTPLTFELWLRPDAMVRHHLLSKWGDGANQEYKLHINGGLIRLDLRDSSVAAMVSAFTATSQLALIGGWHHLAVTYDGRGGATAANGITMYIDGVSVALNRQNNAAYVAMENGTAPLQIGREGPASKHYDGGLDEIRLWTVARTPAEIQSTMMLELGGAEPGLAAYWRFNEGTGTTTADASPAGTPATLIGGPAWVTGGPLVPPAPDLTAPEITNITITNVTASSATIAFATSEVTTAAVSYTPGPGEVPSGSAGAAHVVTLTGLLPDTLYQVTIHVIDRAGNPQTSSTLSLRTLVPPPDVTPPTVALVRPVGTVAGTVTVEASASDNVGVAGVRFKLDGVDLGAPDLVAPYTVVWNTTAVADGPHTITVEAVDAANNLGTASAVIIVANTVTMSPHLLEFDGVDDYLQVADAPSLSFGSGTADTPLTFELWLRPDAMVRHHLVTKWGDGANQEYKLHINGGLIRLDLRDSSAAAMVSAFTATSQLALIGGWHHLAVTYDGRGGATAANGITMYIDGVSVTLNRQNNASYVAMENGNAPLQIGREGPMSKHYDGGLDEVRLWNVARTAAEIQSAMPVELGGSEPGLAAYWRFNEGTGTTTADASPSGTPATLINGPAWIAGGR